MRPRFALALVFVPGLLAAQSLDGAIAQYKARDYAAAQAAFAALAQRAPSDPAPQFWLGRSYLALDNHEASAKAFERAVALNDKSSEYHLWLGRALGRQAQQASKFKQPFLARRVKAEWERAIALDPRSLEPREQIIDFYLQAPGFMGGGVDKARAQQAEISRLSAYRGAFVEAKIAAHEKDDLGVERILRSGTAKYPDSVAVVSALANFYASKNRYPDAWATIDGYAAKHQKNPIAQFMIGRMAAITGQQLDRGEAALRSYLATPLLPEDEGPPSYSATQMRLGGIYEKRGDKARARAAYQEALRLDKNNTGAKRALDALK
ncbi:MAG: tetratricopeptide repeat protein [Gemmatimonadaceae bacterium]|nr:tetratricopeptide repeat protein [Gemmatimonadaceae bacterium]